MFRALLLSRRFAPLFWCQFLSAFNDNYVRNLLALLLLFRVGSEEAGSLISLAVGLFMAPSLLLSGLGGELADAHDKAAIARVLKGAEIFVQMIAAAGLAFASLPLLFAALFGLGAIAALFGPVKYGILPDLLAPQELTAGNALVEAATFLAILLGLISGGLAAAHAQAPADIIVPTGIIVQLALIAIACFATSLFIPKSGIGAPGLRVRRNILASTWSLLREVKRDARLWRAGLAVSWFWLTGAVALSLAPVAIRKATSGGIDVETAVSALFALGIGAGSLLAALIARGRIFLVPVPYAALGMGLFIIDLSVATRGLVPPTRDIGLASFATSLSGCRIGLDILGLSIGGGLFVVPLFAALQFLAPRARRARVVGAVNILNALFMVAGTLVTAVLQSRIVGLSESALLGALGLFNLGAAAYLRRTQRQLAPL